MQQQIYLCILKTKGYNIKMNFLTLNKKIISTLVLIFFVFPIFYPTALVFADNHDKAENPAAEATPSSNSGSTSTNNSNTNNAANSNSTQNTQQTTQTQNTSSGGGGGSIGTAVATGAASGLTACLAGPAITAIAGFVTGSAAATVLAVPTSDLLNTGATGIGATSDTASFWKECVLDGLAKSVVNSVLQTMIRETTLWVNRGFDGSPAFIKDRDAFFESVADRVVSDIIENNAQLQFLCEPFEFDLKYRLNIDFYGTDVYEPYCTIDDIGDNIDGAIDLVEKNFSWDNFLDVNVREGNNIWGVYYNLKNDIDSRIVEEKKEVEEDEKRGSGFLSIKKCVQDGETSYGVDKYSPEQIASLKAEVAGYEEKYKKINFAGNLSAAEIEKRQEEANDLIAKIQKIESVLDSTGFADDLPAEDKSCKQTTPGNVISESLNKAIGSDTEYLQLADEFDELITALINQLVKTVLSEAGLAGFESGNSFSEPDLSNPGLAEQTKNSLNGFIASTDQYIKTQEEKISIIEGVEESIDDVISCFGEKTEQSISTEKKSARNGISQRYDIGDLIKERDLSFFDEDEKTNAIFYRHPNSNISKIELLLPEDAQRYLGEFSKDLDFLENEKAFAQIDIVEAKNNESRARVILSDLGQSSSAENILETYGSLGNNFQPYDNSKEGQEKINLQILTGEMFIISSEEGENENILEFCQAFENVLDYDDYENFPELEKYIN